MRKIKVAIIDDGVNISCVKNMKVSGNFQLINNCVIEYKEADYSENSRHGTECAAIFCTYARNYMLFSIKILNDKRIGCRQDLVDALRWCVNNGIELINLSIGTTYYQDNDEIKSIIEELINHGIIIVAACSNQNIRTYPASLPGVIGVRADRNDSLLENEYIFVKEPHDGINIVAFSKFQINLAYGETILYPSNSYATPYITALVCNYMSEQIFYDITSIQHFLLSGSVNNKFVDYEYIKTGMPLWENNIDVPVIVFIYKKEDKERCTYIIRQLISLFRMDEYCCIACTDDSKAINEPYVFNIEEYYTVEGIDFGTMLLLMYNTEHPDVMLISIEQNKADLILKLHQKHGIDRIIYINKVKLFEKLNKEELLSDKAIITLMEMLEQGCRFYDRDINNEDSINQLYLHLKRIYS